MLCSGPIEALKVSNPNIILVRFVEWRASRDQPMALMVMMVMLAMMLRLEIDTTAIIRSIISITAINCGSRITFTNQ